MSCDLLKLTFLFFIGEWQKAVQDQVSKILDVLFAPESNLVSIRFIRHSPGRRRSSDLLMYDVNCGSAYHGGLVRSTFAKFRRRENPVPRPPELKDINIHPLVSSYYICFSIVLFHLMTAF